MGILSGLLNTFDSSNADCQRLEAEPIFTWFKRAEASVVSRVIKRNNRKNTAPKIAIIKGIRKKE